ncbi:OmpA family protein [Pricia sp. S334]|uniref:OmpA family protein n=1 Tax=Pricia mediterranea TaxID=3076079 RepID=A0ABU3L726_9FLAO|nr:OmpA family protein [Pricia sp. S334]MDT7829551.1 OmpA family protein [Pricia sp. S334]
MKSRLIIAFFFIGIGFGLAQEIESQGDKYFYAYAYEDAIRAYQKQMQRGESLNNYQRLNLADAYFQTRDYKKAAKIYLDVEKNDSIMSDHRFNKMLQSLDKISEHDKVVTLLQSGDNSFKGELLENAEFNDGAMQADGSGAAEFAILTLNGNSPQADISPAFYPNGLLFSSSRKTRSKKIYGPSGEAYLDIYKAANADSGALTEIEPLSRIPSSKFHKSTPHYSESTGNVYYVLSNTEDDELAFDDRGKNALAIGMVNENGSFRFLLKDLSTSFYYPFYDENTGRLYFSANFKDSYGGTDIYYVDMNGGQVMSEPINLGPRINSPGNEIAPYIFDNSLYFSSDVFYGIGGMDIYRSNIMSDNGFSIPVNLGRDINTINDEFGFIIKENPEGGFMGYFSSNKPGGKGSDDIYGFKISEKPGLRTLLFKGRVVEAPYDQWIADASIKILDAEGNTLKEDSSGTNGGYQLEIPHNSEVTLEVSKPFFSTFSKTYYSEELENLGQSPLKIELTSIADIVKEAEGKMVLDINKFFFATGQSNLTPEITMEIDKVVDAVKKFPNLKFSIETHTDSRGGRSSNQRISEQRSAAIADYLLKNGVSSDNITQVRGFGEDKIVNDCSDGVYCLEFLHQQNLRTLFVVENYDKLSQ